VVFSGKLDGNYAERLPLIFMIQHTVHTLDFFRCCSHFYGKYLEKTIEITVFL
jgi:hypothetical protein